MNLLKRVNVVISCGPIPAKVDSVKFITNRFRGGLAFQTAGSLADNGHNVTIIAWKYTKIPEYITNRDIDIVRVEDVNEYYSWFQLNAKKYDAFIMAAAVANLMPSPQFEGKFPSHLYKPGEKFDIQFEIAPRAIDIIKKLNPRCCLVGYKLFDGTEDELIAAAKTTLNESKANIIFANHPSTAKEKKLALTQDGSVIPCSFQEHVALIERAIRLEYYKTETWTPDEGFWGSLDVRRAIGLVKLFENTFEHYGTVAIPLDSPKGAFVTTARGHNGGPVVVRDVDFENRIVHATGKATLNAPALAKILQYNPHSIVLHRHEIPENIAKDSHALAYVFPGTDDEVRSVEAHIWQDMDRNIADTVIYQRYHGYLKALPIRPVNWTLYRDTFPDKYFNTAPEIQAEIDRAKNLPFSTLEVGGNIEADADFAYDPNVGASNGRAVNLQSHEQVMNNGKYSLIFCRNSVNYLTEDEIRFYLDQLPENGVFIANTFLNPPDQKITENEVATLDRTTGIISHDLVLPDESIIRHSFHFYPEEFWAALGFDIIKKTRSSAVVRYAKR